MDRIASKIDADRQTVDIVDKEGRTTELSYDRLIIGTGAESIKPDIKGIDLPGVSAEVDG